MNGEGRLAGWLFLTVLVGGALSSGNALAATGLLPIRAEPALQQKLRSAAIQALDRAGQGPVIGPEEVTRRLLENQRIKASLTKARSLVHEAEQRVLYMDRAAALDASRAAVSELTVIAAQHFAPQLLAQAQRSLGMAALLEPQDRVVAGAAFRAALAAYPELGTDWISPKIARLIKQTAKGTPRPAPPTEEELALLAPLAGVEQLVWLAGEKRAAEVDLRLCRYQHPTRQMVGPREEAAPAGQLERTILALAQITARPTRSVVDEPLPATMEHVGPHPLPLTPSSAAAASPSSPWYKRWWVWSLAAVVVVGSAVAVGLAVRSPDERSYVFRYDLY